MHKIHRYRYAIGLLWALFGLLISMLACRTALGNHQDPNHPEFVWARLEYTMNHDNHYIKGWYTDSPEMDEHIVKLLNRVTGIKASHAVVKANKDLFRYPFVYTVEPEQIRFTPKEAEVMKEWLDRGGFWFADDFHGEEELRLFTEQVRMVLGKKVGWVKLELTHEVFHNFFVIRKIEQVVNDSIVFSLPQDQWYENGETGREPQFLAIKDKHDRILILAAYNNDLGDGLEWADYPNYPREMSAFAFRVICNVVIYAITH